MQLLAREFKSKGYDTILLRNSTVIQTNSYDTNVPHQSLETSLLLSLLLLLLSLLLPLLLLLLLLLLLEMFSSYIRSPVVQ